MVKKRDLIFVLLLSVITFGIYMIYWMVVTKNEINELGAGVPTAWLLIIPLINIYWLYMYLTGFAKVTKKDESTAILYLILFFVISPVAILLIQDGLNKIAK